MELLNTHYYDLKLGDQRDVIKDMLKDAEDATDKIEELIFIEHMISTRPNSTHESQRNISIIINDFRFGRREKNYDCTNSLRADDILYLFASFIRRDIEVCDMLNIQLGEMAGGMCPQGRTHRLLQILIPLIDHFKTKNSNQETK